ncbi:MAG: sodium/solute symporter, partial [Planctomycetota bacterium]|nr:sodium/solute symporter [Planctomycetota bacterium]
MNEPVNFGQGLCIVDWAVIAIYGMGMLSVGWYYSRRTKTSEDYLLGGRSMKSSTVGLSLFATLLSALSFIANPAEVIQHGPMYLASIIAVPFACIIVGYFMIPYIMRLPITSAYELLQERLGMGGRLLGSVVFLVTRFTWMGLIIYLTADKVIVPMLGWPPESSAYVSVGLALLTVIYTTMGGLRAVVITDVIQCLILIGGVVLVIVVITVKMGGPSQWWPTTWAPNWDTQPLFSFNPHVRVTLFWSIAASFVSWLTMVGSDQMAIQRYLATRDAPAARRALFATACTELTVQPLLAIAGLALLGFFLANPNLMPEGNDIVANADHALPFFIMNYLPKGIAGLVVSALLAASMSSLSSGVNSASAVISRDFISLWRRKHKEPSADEQLRTARLLSLIVGAVVIVFGLLIRHVPGNLFEVASKTVNLLPVPVFGMFFMVIFIRRVTAFGA